jgi:hypothetical protein
MVTYILPLFPAFALLTGKMWDEFINENINEKFIKYSSWFLMGMCILVGIASVIAYIIMLPRSYELDLYFSSLEIPLLFFAIPVFLYIFISKKQNIKAFFSLILLMAGMIIVTVTNIMPAVYNSAQVDLIEYVNLFQNYNLGNSRFVTYNLTKPSLVFYSHQKVPFISGEDIELLSKYLSSEDPVFIVTKRKFLDDLSGKVKYNLISPGKRYSLISNIKISNLKER